MRRLAVPLSPVKEYQLTLMRKNLIIIIIWTFQENMKVIVIPVVIGALGTIPKGLKRGRF